MRNLGTLNQNKIPTHENKNTKQAYNTQKHLYVQHNKPIILLRSFTHKSKYKNS